MNKKLITIVMVIAGFSVAAQKKLVPVTQSALTGITLPAGSKQDNRMLMVSTAEMLLEMESKKGNTTISATEVLILPAAASNAFTEDSLTAKLKDLGWKKTVIEADKKYSWLQKEKQYVIMYFSTGKKETSLYFARADSIPKENSQVNISVNSQSQLPVTAVAQNSPVQTNQPIAKTGFAFNTTNFDDGWIATEQEDWVQVTRGNTKVLIHYPNKNADAYNSVLLDGLKNAWNILVAPRYITAGNFEFKPLQSWESIEFAEADAVEKATGKTVHVVLFKKNYSGGGGKYIEFITSSKSSYEQEFGVYNDASSWENWDKIANMATYNKFAVAANDLIGKWTNKFSGTQQYVNIYTGANAGMDTHASAEKFEFSTGSIYNWEISVASGFVGSIKFTSAKATGKWSLVYNWQIHFSDIEKKAKTYNAYFSCVKGARLLWLQDTGYGGYTAYGKTD